ncbi:hypothetical protein MGG_15639 [Pyricularia oryzae 70-15]|uniref:Uncharacterized protein n=1 Tax=Pyricularia oryzae (strain 70-15 / ATCC MYA-4617 / FGSC 8958) TaxID=242507 RepID=G4MWZ4_PYRO7|nr:uncharacterized protein MGG_15639 [Pyricularia oryzae 70-15]EHA54286.1 hypothetical protein MGG_15639 [Pyricularia oryzae 70-15]KAI7923834.1 hypothetical protein M9X92_004129 [Pyricularia oryzae]KAI7929492.1 hypothetical protein M0657_002170 [Pyricularia oryzae]
MVYRQEERIKEATGSCVPHMRTLRFPASSTLCPNFIETPTSRGKFAEDVADPFARRVTTVAQTNNSASPEDAPKKRGGMTEKECDCLARMR